jgi:hypothetical protein
MVPALRTMNTNYNTKNTIAKMEPISSPVLYSAISPATTESTFAGSPAPIRHGDGAGSARTDGLANAIGNPSHAQTGEPPKKKQKRNKPTLSCEECVERKTKVSVSLELDVTSDWTCF